MWIGSLDMPTADGKRRRKTVSSKDRNKVIVKMRELRREIDAGRVPTASTTTVAKWLEYWLAAIKGPYVGPSTYRHYEQAIRLHIIPHIGQKRLDKLTPDDVRAMVADIQKTSTRNAQKAHGTLVTALKAAEGEGLVPRNIAAVVEHPRHTSREREPLPFKTVQHVIATALTSSDEMWASRWVAAFATGARPAELRGLRWRFVDLEKGHIDLAWQLRRVPREHGCGGTCGHTRPGFCPQAKWKVPPGFDMQPCHKSLAFTRPKTKAGSRIVPLIGPMWAMLRHLYTNDTNNPHDLVWHHPDGRPFSQEEETEAWAELMAAAGLAGPTQYIARHSTATLLLKAGVPESTRMRIIGHSSVAAQRIYAHEDTDLAREAMDKLSGLIALAP
jgi:integrase